ncbi:MAG: hypothetical protein IPQ28_12155 [Sphingobacteriales bacterium]|nr:hypothetical protein [Sphingobacteriales bacterium]
MLVNVNKGLGVFCKLCCVYAQTKLIKIMFAQLPLPAKGPPRRAKRLPEMTNQLLFGESV